MTTDPTTAPGEGKWGEHEIVDIHGHLGHFEGYDLRLETLLANARRYGIRTVLVSNIDAAAVPGRTRNLDEKTANEETAETVTRHPDLLRGLFWVRPGEGSPERAERFLARELAGGSGAPLFVGLKLHPEMNRFPADASSLDGYLEAAARARVPVVVHSDEKHHAAHPRRILALGRRHPGVPVVLYHMGFEGPHDAAIDAALEARRAGDARLYLETSQADPDAVLRAVETVGSDRVLFGTDATYYGADHYRRYEPMVDALVRSLGPEERARVLHGNAREIFPLDGPAADADPSGAR